MLKAVELGGIWGDDHTIAAHFPLLVPCECLLPPGNLFSIKMAQGAWLCDPDIGKYVLSKNMLLWKYQDRLGPLCCGHDSSLVHRAVPSSILIHTHPR